MIDIEAVSRAIDPGAWLDDMPIPTRSDVVEFHRRRQVANEAARRVAEILLANQSH